jgi:hypothetical protein
VKNEGELRRHSAAPGQLPFCVSSKVFLAESRMPEADSRLDLAESQKPEADSRLAP